MTLMTKLPAPLIPETIIGITALEIKLNPSLIPFHTAVAAFFTAAIAAPIAPSASLTRSARVQSEGLLSNALTKFQVLFRHVLACIHVL